jgi:hypothetical protein
MPAQEHPMPSLANLRTAREEFEKLEPRGFFYWSVTKLVSAVFDGEAHAARTDELVLALRNYYRFFDSRHPGKTLEQHFADLETQLQKHFRRLTEFRRAQIRSAQELPTGEIEGVFEDFASVLGRVGAAKCLHLLAPAFFPLWDAAILKGYGLENAAYRGRTDAQRYVAFMGIAKAQINNLGDSSSVPANILKALDEYNYCRFTKKVNFA